MGCTSSSLGERKTAALRRVRATQRVRAALRICTALRSGVRTALQFCSTVGAEAHAHCHRLCASRYRAAQILDARFADSLSRCAGGSVRAKAHSA
jgi:hypothetical protein